MNELPTPPVHTFPRLTELRTLEDDWTGITEQARRRKLQNRLNQRARRKFHHYLDSGKPMRKEWKRVTWHAFDVSMQTNSCSGRRLHDHTKATDQRILTTKSFEVARETPESTSLYKAQAKASTPTLPCQLGNPEGRARLKTFAEEILRFYRVGIPSTIHLSDTFRVNTYHAFAYNVQLLGFDDAWLKYDSVSPFNKHGAQRAFSQNSSNCPAALSPTPLQFSVEHHPGLDLFPCPRFRNNYLEAIVAHGKDSIDHNDLCVDMVDGGDQTGLDAAVIVAWTNTWLPSGWEVTEKFLRKWGWLIHGCVELQAGTNAWRRRRGLKPLHFPGC